MNALIGFVIPALLVSVTALLALRLTPAAPPATRSTSGVTGRTIRPERTKDGLV